MADYLQDFKNLLTSHAFTVNVQRETLARRVGNVVATSGNKPLTAVDVTVAMARIDTLLDEYYGRDSNVEGSIFHDLILSEADRAEQLAKDQSNAIIEEKLKDHPELIPDLRIK